MGKIEFFNFSGNVAFAMFLSKNLNYVCKNTIRSIYIIKFVRERIFVSFAISVIFCKNLKTADLALHASFPSEQHILWGFENSQHFFLKLFVCISSICKNTLIILIPVAYIYIFYVPAMALQATIHSCTRQKGRKDSDGRVQDVGLRIPECLGKSTEKYNGMRGQ